MRNKSTTDKLKELLAKETNNFAKKESSLKDAYAKFSKIGIETKSTYSLPMMDTIGKTFREQLLCKSVEQTKVVNISYMQ